MEYKASPEAFAGVVSKLSAGDTIRISGKHSDLYVKGKTNFNIAFDEGASARSLTLINCNKVKIDNVSVDFTPDEKTLGWTAALHINACSDVEIKGGYVKGGLAIVGADKNGLVRSSIDSFIGLPVGYGVNVVKGVAISIKDIEVSFFDRGIGLSGDNIKVVDNYTHDMRRTHISGAGVTNLLVKANRMRKSTPWRWGETELNGDHGDFLAFWIDAGQTFDSENIQVVDNLLEQDDGVAILGMWLQAKTNTKRFIKPVFARNTIVNGNYQGITLNGSVDGICEGNILVQSSGGLKDHPSILLTQGTIRTAVQDNVGGQVKDMSGVTGSDANKLVQSPTSQISAEQAVSNWLAIHRFKPAEPEPEPAIRVIQVKAGERIIIEGV